MLKKHGIPATEHYAADLPELVVYACYDWRAVAYVQLADASEQSSLQLMRKTENVIYHVASHIVFMFSLGPRRRCHMYTHSDL